MGAQAAEQATGQATGRAAEQATGRGLPPVAARRRVAR